MICSPLLSGKRTRLFIFASLSEACHTGSIRPISSISCSSLIMMCLFALKYYVHKMNVQKAICVQIYVNSCLFSCWFCQIFARKNGTKGMCTLEYGFSRISVLRSAVRKSEPSEVNLGSDLRTSKQKCVKENALSSICAQIYVRMSK